MSSRRRLREEEGELDGLEAGEMVSRRVWVHACMHAQWNWWGLSLRTVYRNKTYGSDCCLQLCIRITCSLPFHALSAARGAPETPDPRAVQVQHASLGPCISPSQCVTYIPCVHCYSGSSTRWDRWQALGEGSVSNMGKDISIPYVWWSIDHLMLLIVSTELISHYCVLQRTLFEGTYVKKRFLINGCF